MFDQIKHHLRPFPFWTARVADQRQARRWAGEFPDPPGELQENACRIYGEQEWIGYASPMERKWASQPGLSLPEEIRLVLESLNAPAFIGSLERLTGIGGLIPDPYFAGAGLHVIPPGGFLWMHADFPRRGVLPFLHPQYPNPEVTPLYRRLNVIIYLTPDWRAREDGGWLELRGGDRSILGHPVMSRGRVRVAPSFGRVVIMRTGPCDYHGLPDPTTTDRHRRSLAAYYYTREPPPVVESIFRRALFWPRPGTPEDTPENIRFCLNRAYGHLP